MARLNVQGLARGDKGLMSTIVTHPGQTIVSIDLASGEPTVTTHYSQDPNYYAASFGMVGKAPFYDPSGLLQISDIYLMTMSKSPMGAQRMREVFNTPWDGLTFGEQWLKDDEKIKKFLKPERAFHKTLCLGLGYGMGPKKMVKSAYEKGYELSLEHAQQFHKVYWTTFKGVKSFAQWCTRQVENRGYIVNEFGYRCTPQPFKAYNAFIQSSVSGIMHVFGRELIPLLPKHSRYLTCIHDELLISVPTEQLEDAFKAKEQATEILNDTLAWSVKIRTGWAPGKDWYTAK